MRDIVISQEFELLFSCQNGYIREEKLLQKLIIAILKKRELRNQLSIYLKHLIPVHLPFTKPGSFTNFHLENELSA